MNMLGGMDGFDSGSVIVNGQELAGLRDTELTKYRREKVGFVFQSFNLILELTVRENVALTANSRDPGLVDRMIAAVGLTEKADSYPTKLSGGSSSAFRSPVRLRRIRRYCFATSLPALSIRRPARLCSCCSKASHETAARRW